MFDIVFLLSLLAWESLGAVACELTTYYLFFKKLATVLFWDFDDVADDETPTKDATDASYEVCYTFGFFVLKV